MTTTTICNNYMTKTICNNTATTTICNNNMTTRLPNSCNRHPNTIISANILQLEPWKGQLLLQWNNSCNERQFLQWKAIPAMKQFLQWKAIPAMKSNSCNEKQFLQWKAIPAMKINSCNKSNSCNEKQFLQLRLSQIPQSLVRLSHFLLIFSGQVSFLQPWHTSSSR